MSGTHTLAAPAATAPLTVASETVDLAAMSDESLAALAQRGSPSLRNECVALLLERTKALRIKASRSCAYSAGYSRADTLANGAVGLLRAVDTYDAARPGAASFRIHAYYWIRKHSSNRRLDDQPLRDQIGRDQRLDPKTGKCFDKAQKKIEIQHVAGFPGASGEAKHRDKDAGFGSRRDPDHGMVIDTREALETIPAPLRELVMRRVVNKESVKSLAEAHNVSEGKIKKMLQDGMDRLRAMLIGYDEAAL